MASVSEEPRDHDLHHHRDAIGDQSPSATVSVMGDAGAVVERATQVADFLEVPFDLSRMPLLPAFHSQAKRTLLRVALENEDGSGGTLAPAPMREERIHAMTHLPTALGASTSRVSSCVAMMSSESPRFPSRSSRVGR